MAAQQPSANPKTALDLEKAYWEQIEAAAKAKKAALDAQAAAFQSAVGTVQGQTTITGSVDAGTDPAKPEVLLLTVEAADKAAQKIAENLGPNLQQTNQLLLVTSTDELSLANLNFYELQRTQIDRQLLVATARLDAAIATPAPGRVTPNFVPPVTVIGGALDALTKLGSYFMSDYKFGKVDVTLPDRAMLYAVAARLQPKLPAGAKIFIPQQLAADEVQSLMTELQVPSDHYEALVVKADSARASSAQKPAVAAAIGSADAAAKAWEAFITALTMPPAAPGEPPIDRILRQKVVKRVLVGTTSVLVLSHQIAGAYYTKKNLWTFLGGPPLYSAAAVAVSYALLDGADRHIRASGSVPVHGGYASVSRVMGRFSPDR